MDEQMLEMTGKHLNDVTFFTDADGFAIHVTGRENDGYIRLTEAQAVELLQWLGNATRVQP